MDLISSLLVPTESDVETSTEPDAITTIDSDSESTYGSEWESQSSSQESDMEDVTQFCEFVWHVSTPLPKRLPKSREFHLKVDMDPAPGPKFWKIQRRFPKWMPDLTSNDALESITFKDITADCCWVIFCAIRLNRTSLHTFIVEFVDEAAMECAAVGQFLVVLEWILFGSPQTGLKFHRLRLLQVRCNFLPGPGKCQRVVNTLFAALETACEKEVLEVVVLEEFTTYEDIVEIRPKVYRPERSLVNIRRLSDKVL